MQNWKSLETTMIYLANGEQARANINGISLEDGSGYALVQGREMKVAPLPDTWSGLGYGEIVSIALQNGKRLETVLTPDDYMKHVAYLYQGDSVEATICVFEQGAWREMTDQEYEQERRAWSEDMKDQQRIRDQWRAYRDDEPIPPDYGQEEIHHARELQQRGVTEITDLVQRRLELEGE